MRIGLVYIIISMTILGATVPVGGQLMTKFPVWPVTFITVGLGALLMIPLATLVEKTNWLKLGWKNYWGMFMTSLLTCILYAVFKLYALTMASAVSIGIITSITPAIVFVFSLFLLKERLTLKKVISISLAIIAVLIMNMAGITNDGNGSLLGILFMLLSVSSLALFFIYAKKFAVNVPPLTMAGGLCGIGVLITFPMALFQFPALDTSIITAGDIGLTLFYGLAGWGLAYATTFLAMPKINASTAGMATAVIPIVATVVAIVFFGAAIRLVDFIALLLVIGSIVVAESQEKQPTQIDGEINNTVKIN